MLFARVVALAAILIPAACARGVRVEFDPRNPAIGPFPTDFLTVPDALQRTNLRVNMPLPGCIDRPSDCQQLLSINRLDGFHRNARITVRFNAAIQPDTLRTGVFYIWLDAVHQQPYLLKPPMGRTAINQVVWDPATNSAYAKPDEAFDQGRRYAIIVTDAVKDAAGDPVERAGSFDACLGHQIGGDYCIAVSDLVQRLAPAMAPVRIVSASIFTTMTTTSMLEQVPALLERTSLTFSRTREPIDATGIRDLVFRRDIGGGRLVDERIPYPVELAAVSNIGRLAFGSFRSPRFLNAANAIPESPTRALLEIPQASTEVSFHVWLPRTPAPPGGYPVILAGHGIGDSRFGFPTAAAFGMTTGNFAVVAMDAHGHGGGPRSELVIGHGAPGAITVPSPGRGNLEDCLLLAPGAQFLLRDCIRQTAADYIQLTRHIRAGMDFDGDGRGDLSTDRIFFFGHSLGVAYGTALLAADPSISAAVFTAGHGNSPETAIVSPVYRPLAALMLGARLPPLISSPNFDAEYPLRYEPAKILRSAGSAAIHEALDRFEWIESPGSAYSYAPHLKSATLPGVTVKRILFQIAQGDQTVPNPSNSQLIRGANLRENTSLYRHDKARGVVPGLPANPHAFIAGTDPIEFTLIALAAQEQAVRFLLSDSEAVPDVNQLVRPLFGTDLFEVPVHLPEQLNFLQ